MNDGFDVIWMLVFGSQDHHMGSLTFNELTVGSSECERGQFGDSGGR